MRNIKFSQLSESLRAKIKHELAALTDKVAEAAQPQFFKDKQTIESWLNLMDVENYSIGDGFIVDVKGDVNISGKELAALPIQFGKVDGKFDCSHNKLKQLIGAPKSVVEFDCSSNDLFNLLFSPKEAEVFKCSNNRILSFEGIPAKLKELHCEKNRIKSLKGLPEILGGVLIADCRIAYNEIKNKTGVEFLTLISDKEALNN